MKVMTTIILVLLFCGCENKSASHLSADEKLADAIMKKVSTQIEQELGLVPFGTGGRMMDEIKMLHLSFQCRRPLNIEMSRELLVASVEKFVSEVNANEHIQPYLNNYPFTPKNVEIAIFIQRENGTRFDPNDLCVITAMDGVLEYLSDDSNGPRFKMVHSETYKEALEKLHH